MKILISGWEGVLYRVPVLRGLTLGEGVLMFWDKWNNKCTEVERETPASQVKEELENDLGRWVQALQWHLVQISNTSEIPKWICT